MCSKHIQLPLHRERTYGENRRTTVKNLSKTSVTRRWVKNEARYAHEKGILEPVLIDDVEIPLEFTDLQSVYLHALDRR